MNKILVPTDFSENAENALRFAIAISNRFGSEIDVYHVYNIGSSAAETFKSKVDEIVREDKEKAMKELIDKMNPLLEKGSSSAYKYAPACTWSALLTEWIRRSYVPVMDNDLKQAGVASVVFSLRKADTSPLAGGVTLSG